MLKPLNDRRIIVTGGASGMGEALVRALPELGARVVSIDLAADAGAAIAQESGASFVECDVSSEESVQVAFKSAVADLGGLDVLIHAAGVIPDTRGPAENGTLDTWNRVLAVGMCQGV